MSQHSELYLQVRTPDSPIPKTISKVAMGVALTDEKRTIVQANSAFCDYLGYSCLELVGMKVDDITHPDDLKRTEKTFELLKIDKLPAFTYQKRYVCKDGTIVWGLTTVNRLNNTVDAEPPMFIGFIKDITSQIKIENRLRATNHLYQGLVDNVGVGLSLIDRNHRIRMVNATLAEMFGRPPEDFIGNYCHREFEHKEHICSHCPGIPSMRSGKPQTVETEGRRPDGSRFKVRIKAFPFLEQNGEVGGFVELIEDLSTQYETELALQESEERFKTLAETAPIGIFEVNAEGQNTYSNRAWTGLTGLEVKETLGMGWTKAIPPEERRRVIVSWKESKTQGLPWQKEHRLLHRSGLERWVQATATPVRDADGKLLRWVGTIVDLTSQKEAMQQLAESEERFRSIYEKSGVGMNIIDKKGRFLDVNPAFCAFVGYTPDELKTMTVRDLTHPEDLDRTDRMLREMKARKGRSNYQKRFVRKDGKTAWGDVTAVLVPAAADMAGYGIGVIQDITERKEAQERIEYLSCYDELTALPNKKLLSDRLNHAIDKAKRFQSKVAVLVVGLDRFSKVADNLDQESTNLVFCEISKRVQKIVREMDTLGRTGDAEMVVILEDAKNHEPAGSVAQQILRQISKPISVSNRTFHVTASIGICVFPDEGSDGGSLLRTARAAMGRAKRRGGDAFEYVAPEQSARAHELLALEMDLRNALEKKEFLFFYQPQVELASGKIVGFEALLRWEHPRRGLVSPLDFISLAEETGMIVPIGEWGLYEACRQNMEWHGKGLPLVRMAVNISPRQLRRVDIPALVRHALEETGHPPEYLELEITEGMIMDDVDRAIDIMKVLSGMGVKLAIDDFGTGYSSLQYLKQFPVHRLKVDRNFVKDVLNDPNVAAIATAVVVLAKSMQLEVVAEGIETREQLEFFLEKGCDYCQGYLFSKPLEPSLATEYLAQSAQVPVCE